MKSCPEWKDRLLDFAVGALSSSEARAVEAHAADCPACSAALSQWRLRAADLDAAVRQIVCEEQPSPHLTTRVSASLKARRETSPWSATWPRAVWALGILMLAAILLSSLEEPRRDAKKPGAVSNATLFTWRSPTEGLLQPLAGEMPEFTPRLGESYFPLDSLQEGSKRKERGGHKDEG